MKEVWEVKEYNVPGGVRHGIISNKSNWYIALDVLENNADKICKLFNGDRDKIKEVFMFSDLEGEIYKLRDVYLDDVHSSGCYSNEDIMTAIFNDLEKLILKIDAKYQE